MIVDGRSIAPDEELEVDVCIVGAGPVGMTVTDQLRAGGGRVVLLEWGSLDTPAPPPELEFSSPHFDDPVGSRNFQFGGMVPTWNSYLPDGSPAARYLPLEPIDLDERWWVPHSGWPITYESLLPYLERARARCGVPSFDPLAQDGVDPVRRPIVTTTGDLVTRLDQIGPASAFDLGSLPDLATDPRITLIHSVVATELRPQGGDRAVTTHVRSHHGSSFRVRSRFVLLAGGAIENARLLLSSTAWHPDGLGNRDDNVGRFFMDHPRIQLGHGQLASAASADGLGLYETHDTGSGVFVGKLTLSAAAMRRQHLLNGNMQLAPHHLTARELSAVRSAKRVFTGARGRRWPDHARHHVTRVAAGGLPAGIALVRARARPAGLATTGSDRWTGVVARSFRLNYQTEQAPNRWNRVTLTERRDALGCRVARLQWRWSDLDLDSIRAVRELVARELEDGGVGLLARPDPDELPVGELGGRPQSAHHHLGTTRMSATPRDGVVDPDCRVHGVPNVFVCGGSVFPTGGHANPTLTVIALALRVADELGRELRARA